jgi:complex iron-sulfur molybdoenzyme family reductase subunit gamma
MAALMVAPCSAQTAKPAAGTVISAASSSASESMILQVGSGVWSQAPPKRVSLNRTPPLYDTDEPSRVEIPTADVRLLRAGGKIYVQLSWHDNSYDIAPLEAVPASAPEKRFFKVPTIAGNRFFDAAAVMVPAKPGSALNPSLQMGDPEHPVRIYYWNSVRGAALMEARGRSTTRRTGQSFPAASVYQDGHWTVTFEMSDQPAGTPMAFAVWDGSQMDRDGRKYFSVWYTAE